MLQSELVIRLAQAEGAERIALLCGQLGYAASISAVQERLTLLETDPDHVIYVADLPNARVIAWIQVCIVTVLIVGRQAEIYGLIVQEEYRGDGIGRLLLQWGEHWARQQGWDTIAVHSNVIWDQAHRFYEKAGYRRFKTQAVFRVVSQELIKDKRSVSSAFP
ncbi:GNAT family N-acetyltransferase [Leptolyngbya sp. FACHB-36]|uniref:GNAT family N-acetyltransferase n=1 Tax=Leptolyngbya sp. FACHB-36 TaxID=2692808 RepID=UPI001680D685|nr:GNAT family N-acetyltransferase [Leptolyngbya sp. FACHB-36]MBD2018602.1 GNAT family N-acetyltransferase [Leptolyngbya sp. FACHB-36]